MIINVGVCAMIKIEDFGRVMSSDYAIKILTLLHKRPRFRFEVAKVMGSITKHETNLVGYYIRKMSLIGLVAKERSIHTNQVMPFGKYKITLLGENAYQMAVRVSVEVNLPKNKLLLTSKGKVRLLK